MSFDLFFGLPGHRMIRSSELKAYYFFEKGRPQAARARDISGLPAPVQQVLRALQDVRPGGVSTSDSGPGVSYTLFKTSFLAAFDSVQFIPPRGDLSALAGDTETLYADVTHGGWFCALKPAGDSLSLAAFTSERCISKYISQDDRELLLDEDWFVPGRFFCILPGEEHFMQIINHRGAFLIEFRAGPGRPLYRARESELERVDQFLEGYLSGENMNSSAYGFSVLTAPDPPQEGLPERDGFGRWLPPPAPPILL